MFADVPERGYEIYHGQKVARPLSRWLSPGGSGPAWNRSHFDDGNIAASCEEISYRFHPARLRRDMLDKHIRLVKSDNGGRFETISNVADVIKLAGRGGAFDLESECFRGS